MLLEVVITEDDQLLGIVVPQHDLSELFAEGACAAGNEDNEIIPSHDYHLFPEPDGSVTPPLQLQTFEHHRQLAIGLGQVR